MIIILRALGLGAALAVVLVVAEAPAAALLASAAAVLCLAAAAINAIRPWATLAAAVAACATLSLVVVPPEPTLAQSAALTAALAAGLWCLHNPALQAPARRGIGGAVVLLIVALVAGGLTWGPGLRALGQDLALLDPSSAAGTSVRLALSVVVLLLGVMAVGWSARRLRHPTGKAAPPPET